MTQTTEKYCQEKDHKYRQSGMYDVCRVCAGEKPPKTTINEESYLSAVKGRSDFRKAFRDKKKQCDEYGICLLMISQGCADFQEMAKEVLVKYGAYNHD